MSTQRIKFANDVPGHILVQGRHVRLIGQILYTYLWLRLGELDEGASFQVRVQEKEGKTQLEVTDSASPTPAIFDGQALGDADSDVGQGREQLAMQCLKRLTSCLGSGGFRPVEQGAGCCLVVDPIEWSGG